MNYMKNLILFILYLMGSFIYGSETDEKVPLTSDYRSVDASPMLLEQPPELSEQPPELICLIACSLETEKDVVHLRSTCKRLYGLGELNLIIKFAHKFERLQRLMDRNPPFFNDDQEKDLSEKLRLLGGTRKKMEEILNVLKVCTLNGNKKTVKSFHHSLHAKYSNLREKIKEPGHPFFRQINSIKKHDLVLTDREEESLKNIILETGVNPVELETPLWKRVVHTIGRNRKIILLGTIALGVAWVAGTYYLFQHPPFDPQSFISAYDSPQTGRHYSHFSVNGYVLPQSVYQPVFLNKFRENNLCWCSACGSSCRFSYGETVSVFKTFDDGGASVYCNKTASEAIAYLQQETGFNFHFWNSLVNKTFNSTSFVGQEFYCNLRPSNTSLVCGRFSVNKGISFQVADISELFLDNAKQLYDQIYITRAERYGGFMGALSFMFLGFMLWSWCLG